jgi:hypothetical protein
MTYHTYFHDTEFTLPDSATVVKEKGRIYKNVYKDGSFSNYTYEVKYYINGEELNGFPIDDKMLDCGLIFTDPEWAYVSPDEISRAIIRKLKK